MSSDMPEMSNPFDVADDWVQATLGSLNVNTVTFRLDGTGETVAAEFASPMEAFDFVGHTGPKFEYSAIEAAVRDANGTVVPLPEPPAERIPCGPEECDLIVNGHKAHWIPVLRAGNGPKEDWLPITIIEHDGTKLIISTEDGVYTCYNHDPERLANAKYYNREWPVLRGDFNGHGYPVSVVSSRPIGPCSHA